ncbi:family 16 glycosylhydrolase [Bradyrhizobium sp. 160]|uniref:Ig-like domain-containing protein n=1 Tax=Bradyrhizobium sp. 160 TaxID=2782634 RepID=UPI001FF80260|nr:Ig-like domain-containing protein [Bradyrhizobium sp. 160]MCK1623305.1 family 16 glycosylhydrolase [Bradyrhizobium sp. 160]
MPHFLIISPASSWGAIKSRCLEICSRCKRCEHAVCRAPSCAAVEFPVINVKEEYGMTLSAPTGFTSSDLVFEENFSGTTLDNYWHNYITSNAANGWPWNSNGSGGSGMGNQFDAEYFMPSQVSVSNGVLDLTANKQAVNGVSGGSPYTFPVTSGAVSSYGNFEFNGGYLQISMKAPSGDGSWPGLWLLPGKGSSSGDNFEIDMQEGGYTGSEPANQAFSWHLHTPSGAVGGVIDTGIDLTAGFHTYGINWVPGQSMTWYLDGKQMAQVTSAQAPIPNEPMELLLSNSVANSNAAGWHTTLDSSTPSSMTMQIDDVQLYQKAGSGETVLGTNVTSSSGTSSSGTSSSGTSSTGSSSVAAPVIASFSSDTGVVGDGITKDNTPDLKGTAAANSTIKIYDGSTQIGTTTADAAGGWDYITQVLSDAKHTLTATATNSSGQTSVASAALAVTVDTKAPATPTIASDTVGSNNQVVASGQAEANSTIRVYDGTTQVGTATTNTSGAWAVTTAALAAGTHVLTATATDVAGNVSAPSAAFDSVISSSGSSGTGTSGTGTSGTGTSGTGSSAPTPPAAPKIASFSSDTGTAGDHITSDKTVTLAGTAAANSTVKVLDGTTQLGGVTADASGAWHYTTAALPDGKHSFTASDTVSGVTSKASTALDVTVDSAAPDAPVLLSDPTTHNRATVSGTAEAGSLIKLYEGTTLLGTATVASDGDWSVTTPNLKHGSHTFTATATDAAGNTSALSQPIDPPIGSHTGSDTSTVEVTNVRQHWDHTATIKGTADPNSPIKLLDGTISVGSATTDADGKWSFHTSDLSDKTHAFTAEQVDTTGHVVGTGSGEAIIGSGRNDTLTGTTGNDILVGKRGADTFEFASNFGHDVIKDFAAAGPAHDAVQFSKGVFDTFASVLSHAAQSGHDVVIATGSDTLTLKNTKLDALNSHDFHFA